MSEYIISDPITMKQTGVAYASDYEVTEYTLTREYKHGEKPELVSIVRCRDCKYMRHGCWYFAAWDEINGEHIPASVSDNGFCAWGEMRAEK